jgi:hypothetical protein
VVVSRVTVSCSAPTPILSEETLDHARSACSGECTTLSVLGVERHSTSAHVDASCAMCSWYLSREAVAVVTNRLAQGVAVSTPGSLMLELNAQKAVHFAYARRSLAQHIGLERMRGVDNRKHSSRADFFKEPVPAKPRTVGANRMPYRHPHD